MVLDEVIKWGSGILVLGIRGCYGEICGSNFVEYYGGIGRGCMDYLKFWGLFVGNYWRIIVGDVCRESEICVGRKM